jgi:hypothetical protein
MRKIMLFLAVFGLVGSLWAADPTMGTWKLNLAKSKIPASDAANLKETILSFREIDANTVEGIQTQTLKDGKTNTMKWTTPTSGGTQTYQEGGPANGISSVAVKIEPLTMYNVYLLNGRQVGLYHVKFSKDFKTFTMTSKGTDAQGKPYEYLGFFEKQ